MYRDLNIKIIDKYQDETGKWGNSKQIDKYMKENDTAIGNNWNYLNKRKQIFD